MSTFSRRRAIAFPRISSARPFEYTSALSNIVRPASRQMSTSRVAPSTSDAPQCLKNSPPPPNVPVPSVRTGTISPDPPSCRTSILQESPSAPALGQRGQLVVGPRPCPIGRRSPYGFDRCHIDRRPALPPLAPDVSQHRGNLIVAEHLAHWRHEPDR